MQSHPALHRSLVVPDVDRGRDDDSVVILRADIPGMLRVDRIDAAPLPGEHAPQSRHDLARVSVGRAVQDQDSRHDRVLRVVNLALAA